MSLPLVSIIMPVRNEADFIATSLGAVLSQDYPHDRLEVLIADGLSTDGTREIAVRKATGSDIPVKILDNSRQITPAALNIASGQARGEIIIRVDGHCKIMPDYVSRCVRHLSVREVAGVGGPIRTVAHTATGRAIAAAMSSTFGVGDAAFRIGSGGAALVDTIAFPAYHRQVVEQAGPYDEELKRNQDDEYNYRLRKLGYTLLLADDIQSEYYSRVTFGKLWSQYFEYGFYKVRVVQKHTWQMRPRQFAPPLFVLLLMGGGLLAPLSALLCYGWLAVVGFYLLANLTASALVAARADWRLFPLLPMAFGSLHIAYGAGFLAGLVKWWRRWGDHSTAAPPPLTAAVLGSSTRDADSPIP